MLDIGISRFCKYPGFLTTAGRKRPSLFSFVKTFTLDIRGPKNVLSLKRFFSFLHNSCLVCLQNVANFLFFLSGKLPSCSNTRKIVFQQDLSEMESCLEMTFFGLHSHAMNISIFCRSTQGEKAVKGQRLASSGLFSLLSTLTNEHGEIVKYFGPYGIFEFINEASFPHRKQRR